MNKPKVKIILIDSFILLLIFNIIFSCGHSVDTKRHQAIGKKINSIGYDFSHPDMTLLLPPILHEISGIATVDSSNVACVQDELGIVFLYNLARNEITGQLAFHTGGDYEDLAIADKAIYILRSDGLLFEIMDYEAKGLRSNAFQTMMAPGEYEGLCYDRINDRLLIAAKITNGKNNGSGRNHPIYEFSLNSQTLVRQPVFNFDLSIIQRFASENIPVLPFKAKKKGHEKEPEIRFRPSAIGIHPVTGKLFVLSGMDQLLFVFNMNGSIEYIEKLNPEIFNMAEGITFMTNGDMLVSNEGKNRRPTILRFNYRIN